MTSTSGAGHELLAHHAHEVCRRCSRFLHGGPALDGGGVEVIGVHPIGEHHAHLAICTSFSFGTPGAGA